MYTSLISWHINTGTLISVVEEVHYSRPLLKCKPEYNNVKSFIRNLTYVKVQKYYQQKKYWIIITDALIYK